MEIQHEVIGEPSRRSEHEVLGDSVHRVVQAAGPPGNRAEWRRYGVMLPPFHDRRLQGSHAQSIAPLRSSVASRQIHDSSATPVEGFAN